MIKHFLIAFYILITMVFMNSVSFSHELNTGFDTVNTCTSYEYIDDHLRCGYQSYLQQFAIPYCNRYLQKNDIFSEKAQLILADIRSCLQTELLAHDHTDLTCENIEDIGVESHYGCYLQSGFCELEELDKVKVMWIARRQVLNIKVMSVFTKVMSVCVE